MVDYDALIKFVQDHFTDGLALVIGSGLSAAEGIPGMPALATHLSNGAGTLAGTDAALWNRIKVVLDTDEGLEAALLKHPPSDTLEIWIGQETCELLLPKEREVMSAVLRGERTLRLTTFLAKVLKPTDGLPILTPNYDRLIEVACEMAGFHVDTTAVGHYAGAFDHARSCMGSCRGITTRAKTTVLAHFPRAIVLKPHGSFDWYRSGNEARRCSVDLDAERLMITPGINKYRAGYNSPFDKHRELANDYIKEAGRLLVVGYGFNDDHLQTHLVKRIQDGTPTLILNESVSSKVAKLAAESPRCVCLSKPTAWAGVAMVTKGHRFEQQGHDFWDLGVLAKELLT
ncbi:MAG: SIR2 family protein [Burkholderiales bacterium]